MEKEQCKIHLKKLKSEGESKFADERTDECGFAGVQVVLQLSLQLSLQISLIASTPSRQVRLPIKDAGL